MTFSDLELSDLEGCFSCLKPF